MSRWEGGVSPGDLIRAQDRERNLRLAALGIHTRSRLDLLPKLSSEDWDKLVALAEAGKAAEALKMSDPPDRLDPRQENMLDSGQASDERDDAT